MSSEIDQKPGGANKYERILALSEERRIIIDNMLIRGDSAAEVAKMIQQDWALYQDVKPETLERQIQRYKLDKIQIPEAAKQKLLAQIAENTPRIAKRLERAIEEFDVEAAHIRLILAQEKRVHKWLESGASGLPSSAVREDMKFLHTMYVALENFYLETGKIRRAPKQLQGSIEIDDAGRRIEFEAEWKQTAEVRRVIGEMIELMKGKDYEEVDGQAAPDSGGDGEEDTE